MTNAEEVNALRNRLKIKVKGRDVPDPVLVFGEMDMKPDIKVYLALSTLRCAKFVISNRVSIPQHVVVRNIENSDWKEPTPIQMQAIPCMLNGRDVLAAAPTGK